MTTVKVLLVEDDPVWQRGIERFLGKIDGIDFTAAVSDPEEALVLVKNVSIDVVLMDILLNKESRSGLDATLNITYHYPRTKVIMLTSLKNEDDVFYEAFLNGAYDYIDKDEFERLPEVIMAAANNKRMKYGERLKKLVLENKKILLRENDKALLQLILKGYTQKEIAEIRQIRLSSVKKHIHRILKKFNWNQSSKELAKRCQMWGLLDE